MSTTTAPILLGRHEDHDPIATEGRRASREPDCRHPRSSSFLSVRSLYSRIEGGGAIQCGKLGADFHRDGSADQGRSKPPAGTAADNIARGLFLDVAHLLRLGPRALLGCSFGGISIRRLRACHVCVALVHRTCDGVVVSSAASSTMGAAAPCRRGSADTSFPECRSARNVRVPDYAC